MTFSLVLLSGLLVAGGLTALVVAFVPAAPQLTAALARITDEQPGRTGRLDAGPVTSRSERLGALLYRLSPATLGERQRRALRLQDKSIAEFYADKAVMAVIGLVLPTVAGFALAYAFGYVSPLPAAAGVIGVVVGWFAPDLLLRRANERAHSGAAEAVLTYIELVTLERLANASATQALHNAAALSEVALFVQIRTALERARLEQQSPYAELRRLADQLRLPELADIADTMQLDETGAALSGALRARVRELRDAHLTRTQTQAATDAEGMTLCMALPALIFGLIFLVAAMLRILTG